MAETLCWKCKNTNRFKCSWFNDFTPVPGWTAEKEIRHYTHTSTRRENGKIIRWSAKEEFLSYYVRECPNFDPMPVRKETGEVYEPYSKPGSKEYYKAERCEKCYTRRVCESTGATCNQRSRMQKASEKPENPFKKGTKIHKLYEGDWKNMDTGQIAKAIHMSSRENVRRAIYEIKERTGYKVEFKLDEKQSARARRKG